MVIKDEKDMRNLLEFLIVSLQTVDGVRDTALPLFTVASPPQSNKRKQEQEEDQDEEDDSSWFNFTCLSPTSRVNKSKHNLRTISEQDK